MLCFFAPILFSHTCPQQKEVERLRRKRGVSLSLPLFSPPESLSPLTVLHWKVCNTRVGVPSCCSCLLIWGFWLHTWLLGNSCENVAVYLIEISTHDVMLQSPLTVLDPCSVFFVVSTNVYGSCTMVLQGMSCAESNRCKTFQWWNVHRGYRNVIV